MTSGQGLVEIGDDPRAESPLETERVADGEYSLPDPQATRVAERHGKELFGRGLDLEHRNVGRGVLSHDLCLITFSIEQGHFNFLRPLRPRGYW